MGDETPVFLTEQRRAVLEGDYSKKFDGGASTERTHHTRIRQRTTTALDELIEVAESRPIHNPDVFDPQAVAKLVRTLLTMPEHLDEDNPDDEDARQSYHAYRDQLRGAVAWELSQSNFPASDHQQ
jgi:hypothetical protein